MEITTGVYSEMSVTEIFSNEADLKTLWHLDMLSISQQAHNFESAMI